MKTAQWRSGQCSQRAHAAGGQQRVTKPEISEGVFKRQKDMLKDKNLTDEEKAAHWFK